MLPLPVRFQPGAILRSIIYASPWQDFRVPVNVMPSGLIASRPEQWQSNVTRTYR